MSRSVVPRSVATETAGLSCGPVAEEAPVRGDGPRSTAPRGLGGSGRARRALLAAVAATYAGLAPIGVAQASDRPLLVLGDSLSAEYGLPRGSGWVALLEKRLAARKPALRVVNASISGETTSGGRTRLPELLAKHAPGIVVVELGGNDALRGLPLGGTEANLRDMVRAAKAAGARPLLLGMRMPPNYGRAYGEQFEAVYRRVAEAEKVPLVPFFLEAFGENEAFFQPDRIHPAEKAQPLMLDAVWPTLSKML
jgi:acyl-CoA thioesterase-1